MSGGPLDPRDEVERLREELQQVQIQKYELLRSTSAEIDRLRQTIKYLTGKADIKSISSIRASPLSTNERNHVKNRVLNNHPDIDFNEFFEQQQEAIERSLLTQARGSTDESSKYKNNSNNDGTDSKYDSESKNDSYNNNNNNNNNLSANDDDNDSGGRDNDPDSRLSTIREDPDESNSSNNSNRKDNDQIDQIQRKVARMSNKVNDREKDSSFRLSIKRMSQHGFVFSELGFMTTDFEQLQRGHTQWVNQCIHHTIQNGIAISASNDSCIFFWRFRESTGKEELMQEKYDSLLGRYKGDHGQQRAIISEARANKPNIQSIHSPGEINLHPLLKINTGFQIKGISMSGNGVILACLCYDEEEEDGEPELELYYDSELLWKFEQDWNFKDVTGQYSSQTMSNKNKDRTIHRKVIPLPFAPIDRAIAFTKDSKFVFVAMSCTRKSVSESGADEKEVEACTLACINVTTKMVRHCTKINDLMADDEHIKCFSISPDGQRIAMGTSLGRLIVTGVRALTGSAGEPDGNENASLWRIWVDEENVSNNNDANDYMYAGDGALSAVCWSADCEWLITGYESGSIKLWKKNKEPRLSINVNKVVSIMMKRAKVPRKSKVFTCKWMLEGLHVETINSFSIEGSLLVSGSDDGTIIVHDLCQTFVDDANIHIPTGPSANDNDANAPATAVTDNSAPSTLAKIERLHGGRMVTSVGLSANYREESVLVPTAGLFLVSSGADDVIHCLSLLGVLRNSIRSKFYNQKL